MIVVDTSVWIDFLRGPQTPQSIFCAELIDARSPVALTDVVLTELLQGLSSDSEARRLERYLRRFPILRLETLDDYAFAARLYRTARGAGVTIGNSLDCLIAATCIRAGAPILHSDADFDRLASCTELRVYG